MRSLSAELWTKVTGKLGITARFSTPWHFASHGLIERTNRSIEDVLRKYIILHGEQWHLMLPYILSALRDVPHSGNKFSANELVFGHRLRNMLQIARETYIGQDPLKENLKISTIEYLRNLQQRLETTMKVANENT